MTRIRIIHVIGELAVGGTEQIVRHLLVGLDTSLFEQVVCTVVASSELEIPAHVRVVTLGRARGSSGLLVPGLTSLISRERPDIVHSRNWGTIEAVPAARLAHVPGVIHSEHGLDLQTMGRQPWRRRVLRRLCYRCAGRVFAVSQELRNYYSQQLDIPASRLRVIPNGVETQYFCPDPDLRRQVRQTLGVSPQTLIVGAVGRLDPVKDHRTLFQAVERAVLDGVDARVVIVGDGPERSGLESDVAARPGLSQRVTFVGAVGDVRPWLNSFDIFALPSLYEGMSNTLLEAMAVGIPPLATAVGGNTEVVEHGSCGLLFRPRDAQAMSVYLKCLAADPDWRRRLGSNARQRVESCFSLRGMLSAYAQMYSDVLKRDRIAQAEFSHA
jgi:sugar transferase (PEP-CTERM/EpsH1 system associated)